MTRFFVVKRLSREVTTVFVEETSKNRICVKYFIDVNEKYTLKL